MILDIQFAENAQSFNSTFGEVIKVGNATDDTQTYILVTPDGREIPAVMVEELTVFDATPNDIRIGKVAATDTGVTVGEKDIPSYHTREGVQLILSGEPLIINSKYYDYTELQALVCGFNKTTTASVSTELVVIKDNVYAVKSVDSISVVDTAVENKINLGIINTSDTPQLIRYFMYKEIY